MMSIVIGSTGYSRNYALSINFNVFSMIVRIHNNQYSIDIDQNSFPRQ